MKTPLSIAWTHLIKDTEFARLNGIAGDLACVEGKSFDDPEAKVFVLTHDGVIGPFRRQHCELEPRNPASGN